MIQANEKNERLYHYTSPAGLNGILSNEYIHLFFTRLDCLNDMEEGKEVLSMLLSACNVLLEKKKITTQQHDKLIEVKPNYKKNYSPRKADGNSIVLQSLSSSIPFICCYSRDKDSLPMWNYYSKGSRYEGYNIGLNFESSIRYHFYDLERGLISNPAGNLEYLEVIYDDEEKISIITKFLEERIDKKKSLEYIELELSDAMNRWEISFKNSVFKHESEVRLALYVPNQLTENNELKKIPLRFRESNGLLVPYMEVLLDKAALSQVTVGPLLEAELATETVNSLLNERKYDTSTVEIKGSEVPIRF